MTLQRHEMRKEDYMDKKYAKYMRSWKLVKNERTGTEYKLLEDMDEGKDTVKAVNTEVLKRYELLSAWIRNWDENSCGFRDRFTEDIESCRAERKGYEEHIRVSDVEPANMVRFITPDYKEKFRVRDLTLINVDGKPARVVYLDDCHFAFADGISLSFFGGCLHICHFAELCQRGGICVEPADEES